MQRNPFIPKYRNDNRNIIEVNFIVTAIQEVLENIPDIIFAYLYGSILECTRFKDVDIALYAVKDGADSLDLEILYNNNDLLLG